MGVNYVICAAGEGSRFREDFPSLRKPEILLKGRTMLEWSISSLPILSDDKVIVLTQKAHNLKKKLFNKIQSRFPFNKIAWVEIEAATKGQLETALLARDLLDLEKSIVIFNSDTYFEARHLQSMILDSGYDGVIPCINEEKGDSWSFCEADENSNRILRVKEKVRISNWCSVGFYYFKDCRLFLNKAENHINRMINNGNETYVAPLYQDYIDEGLDVRICDVNLFKPMGTPYQVENYWGIEMRELVIANSARQSIVVDLDNTITIEDPSVSYAEKLPNLDIIAKLHDYKKQGFKIIINTARRMKTHKNDESLILKDVGQDTLTWLKKNNVPYDGLKFGKPFAENGFYVDDKSVRPSEFLEMSSEELLNLVN